MIPFPPTTDGPAEQRSARAVREYTTPNRDGGYLPFVAPSSGLPLARGGCGAGAGRGGCVVTGTTSMPLSGAPGRPGVLAGGPAGCPSTGGIFAAQLEGFHSGAGTEFADADVLARSICAGDGGLPLSPERNRGGCNAESGGVVVRQVPPLEGSLPVGARPDRSFSAS